MLYEVITVPIGDIDTGVFSVLAISSLTSISEKNKSGEFLIEKIQEAAKGINKSLSVLGKQ